MEVAKAAHQNAIIVFTRINRAGPHATVIRTGSEIIRKLVTKDRLSAKLEYKNATHHLQIQPYINAAANNLIKSVIPQRWRTLMNQMSVTDIDTWRNSPRETFQHCVIKNPRGETWIFLKRATYKGIYSLMVAGKVKGINYDSILDGPRGALSEMLGRPDRPKELWLEIKRFEKNPKADDLLWRFLHAKVAVGSDVGWLLSEKKVCLHCKDTNGNAIKQTIPYVWVECEAAKEVWDLFAKVWERLYGLPPKFVPRYKNSLVALFARYPISDCSSEV